LLPKSLKIALSVDSEYVKHTVQTVRDIHTVNRRSFHFCIMFGLGVALDGMGLYWGRELACEITLPPTHI